ncbi:MAG: CPBP family intramembrane metalloprotease [Peptococcaceae bacterium]|jgi:membrane protease YdiL (CAAX protease family)|nr:CPBP family intramembrane metalloprotease [Peptococcaceae bacterium]
MTRKNSPNTSPVWNIWQGILLILIITLVEVPLGWLNNQQDLGRVTGLLSFVAASLGDCLLYFVVIALFLRLIKCSWRDLGFVAARRRSHYTLGIICGVVLFIVIGALGNLLQQMIGTPAPQPFAEAVIGVEHDWEYILLLLLGSVAAPLKEEMIFRGLLYPALRSALGVWKGILLSGVIFAALHFDLIRFLPLFLGGVMLTWLYERTKSIWPCVLAHGTWNMLMALALWLQR